jgi:oligoendopeptidase F
VVEAAYDDEIDVSLITTIYQNVETFKDVNLRYSKLIKKMLKDKLGVKKIRP